MRSEPGPRVIEGVPGSIRADRWSPCSICNRSDGAVVRCNYGHCATGFHPLCGRNVGLYLAMRESGSKLTPRVYCCLHSDIQRRKDQQPGTGKVGLLLTFQPGTGQGSASADLSRCRKPFTSCTHVIVMEHATEAVTSCRTCARYLQAAPRNMQCSHTALSACSPGGPAGTSKVHAKYNPRDILYLVQAQTIPS